MASAKSAGQREVSVFGTDASGRPFNQPARVVSLDGLEVAIEGLERKLDVNNIVGLRHGGQKARFRVVWIGHKDTPQHGQVGLRAVETEKDIFAGADLAGPGTAGRERRRYPRVQCHGDVKFRREGSEATLSGALTLLSEGGCYIQSATTFPQFAHLDLSMKVEGMELQSVGEVRLLEPGSGMGIAFVEMNRAQRIRLHEWVSHHCKQHAETWH